jgi:NAD(P)-dependent dehydrogenase (short-subunit alcohol dehydrogenase family)
VSGRLAGKVAFVTGGARGLGAATARRYCEEGAAVMVGDVLEEQGRAHVVALRGEGHQVDFVRLDVADEQGWEQALAATKSAFGSTPVVLANVAGIAPTAALAEETLESWTRTLAVNLTGAFLGMRAVIPHMRGAGGGAIVNVSSTWADVGFEGFAAYHASKGGLVSLTRNAAVTYAADRIRVNAVSPGTILTEMSAGGAGGAGVLDRILGLTPMGRGAQPVEIADALVYLASDQASFVTGAVLAVDGGYTAQ